jgi:hypothetical protein
MDWLAKSRILSKRIHERRPHLVLDLGFETRTGRAVGNLGEEKVGGLASNIQRTRLRLLNPAI